jgi:hypothetical protein
MQRTIFSTPLVRQILRTGSVLFLRHTGWRVHGALPPEARKSVFIAAPHTAGAQCQIEGIGAAARLVFITHEATEAAVQATVRQLRDLDVVRSVGGLLRVLGA